MSTGNVTSRGSACPSISTGSDRQEESGLPVYLGEAGGSRATDGDGVGSAEG